MRFWMWSFSGFIWWSRSLSLMLGLSARWGSARGWVMFSLREHDITMLRSRYLLARRGGGGGGGVVSPLPRSSSSGPRRATSAHGQGVLRITVRASLSSTSPRASHSSSTSHRLVFPDELAGSSDRAGPASHSEHQQMTGCRSLHRGMS